MDVGQPKDFLIGIGLYLNHVAKTDASKLAIGPHIVGNVLIVCWRKTFFFQTKQKQNKTQDPSAKIGQGCKIGPNVTIGPNVVIEDGVRLSKCALFENVIVRSHAWVSSSIVGWNSTVGRWVRQLRTYSC